MYVDCKWAGRELVRDRTKIYRNRQTHNKKETDKLSKISKKDDERGRVRKIQTCGEAEA